MTAQAQTKARSNTARGRRSPRTILRNAFITTFMIFLAMYPVFDSFFGWGKMGAMPAILIYTLLALGLNIVVGFAGLLDLGYVAFFAIGAYTSAVLGSGHGSWPWLLTVPAGIAVAMTAGVLLGLPTLRLRGDYLAIVTLGFGEIIRITANNMDWLGGPRGVQSIPHPPSWFGLKFGVVDAKPYYWLALLAIVLIILVYKALEHSRVGRSWLAIREDEDAAELMGRAHVQVQAVGVCHGRRHRRLLGDLLRRLRRVDHA